MSIQYAKIYKKMTKKDINNQKLWLTNENYLFHVFSVLTSKKWYLGNNDLPFIYDERIIGKWNSVGFVDTIEIFSPENECDGLYLKEIDFSSDGRLEQTTMDEVWHDKWTKGSVINIYRTTVAAYEIKRINGTEYLFMEWKMGNYIYWGMAPEFYVFVRAWVNTIELLLVTMNYYDIANTEWSG